MPSDTRTSYRTQYEAPATHASPREDLGRTDLPVVGEVTGEVRLDRSLHLALDRKEASLRPAGGLVLRAAGLPTIAVRAVHVDLVDGLVRTDADGLGPLFDRALTVALCSALRQTIGWKPGVSVSEPLAENAKKWLPRARRFPRTSVALTSETRIEVDVDGEAVTVTLTRPALLRFLGLPLKVSALRYAFATAKVTAETRGVGPVRRGILALVAWGATRWLRARQPAAMARPNYDLFADEQRRAHLQDWVKQLRAAKDQDAETEEMGAGAGRPGHELARAGAGDKAGMLGLLSASKVALLTALVALKISADDVPPQTRVLARLPLGPLSRLALCTDRGGEVVLTKHPGGLRIEAPLGIYLFADQFPELSELRLTRVDISFKRKKEIDVDIQTEPPLGPLARALLDRSVDAQVRPRLPIERLSAGGLWDDGPDHLLWRQDLGAERSLMVRTQGQAEVKIRHTDDALVIEAPAGLETLFDGVPVPASKLRRIAYRWDDGAIETDGTPELGAFGQTVAAALMRTRAAPHLPHGLGVRADTAAPLDPALLEQFSAEIAGLKLPVIGSLALRFDPRDILDASLGPAALSLHSERGLLLVAPDLQLALQVRGVNYDMRSKKLELDASPAPGPYITALAATCLEALLIPLLGKAIPLTPDEASGRWTLQERFGLRVSLPPGASLTARRTADALELGGSEPLEIDGQGGLLADFTVRKLRWTPADDRVVVDSTPTAGPLISEVTRRALDRLVPDVLARSIAERLALPELPERTPVAPPTSPPLFATEVAQVGPVALHVDARSGITLTMRRDRAELRFGAGAHVRAEKFAAQLVVRGLAVTFLPFTISVDAEPATGELEHHLLAQLARSLLAPVLRMFWPADRAPQAGRDVLLFVGAGASWGPLELCVPPGGEVEVRLDHEGLAMRSDAGVFVAGLDWLPQTGVRAASVRFEDGAVALEVGEVEERFYHEAAPVSATTTAIASAMLRVLVSPHVPGWAQRLGMRVLPPPPPLPVEPSRKLVWQSQLPGGLAKIKVGMDPMDLLEIRADRTELSFTSELGLHLDLEHLGLRLTVFRARYHMLSGELQLGDMGRFENAVAEGLVHRALSALDPTGAPQGEVSLLDVLERFPVGEDGNRTLFGEKVVRVYMLPESQIVLRIGTEGLLLTVDPPIKVDGPAILNFVFGGLRYDFSDGEFHVDFKHDGVISRALSGTFKKQGEDLLNSLRPALPAAMRRPGYSLADDPNPEVTLAGLVRTVSRRTATPVTPVTPSEPTPGA